MEPIRRQLYLIDIGCPKPISKSCCIMRCWGRIKPADGNFRLADVIVARVHVKASHSAGFPPRCNRSKPIKGVVEGIGWGVLDEERINLPRSVPYVQRSLNWVRVAQRFPVRVRLENSPEQLMRLGASAVVEVKHGDTCS
jgi:hypothetical protein